MATVGGLSIEGNLEFSAIVKGLKPFERLSMHAVAEEYPI
jgi:hypothetical protein